MFLLCGAVLLAITYVLVHGASFAPPPDYDPPAVSGNAVLGIAAERTSVLHQLLLRSGIALAVMAVASIWLGWVVAGRVLSPLRLLTARTRAISEANLHERLALVGPQDEIKDLSDTIDGLLARLEDAFLAQRRFVANVSHELRTPLAMMRTSLDVAASKPRPMSDDAQLLSGKLREGLDQADALVESFLTLARAQAGQGDQQELVSLPELVRDWVDQRGSDRPIDLSRLAVAGGADVRGIPTLLGRLVANLLDNALRYNRPGGRVSVKTETRGGLVTLVVDNDGAPMSASDVGRLLEPFHRGGVERIGSEDGVGMGLPIVSAIATAHHGQLELHARQEGGLTAVVILPAAPEGETVT